MKHNVVSQWMSSVLMLDCILTNLSLRGKFINTVQFAGQAAETLQSRLCLMMLDWNILLLLAWMYFWHISFVSTWRNGGHASGPVPKDGLVTSCFTGMFWSFGKQWRITLHSQLAVCSRCTGATWHLQTDLHQHAEDIPKGRQGDCPGRFSKWATHSFSSASIAVGVGRSSSQNFMQLRCYILQTWLQLQKVNSDEAESKLI